jgi:dihydropteroate synthase
MRRGKLRFAAPDVTTFRDGPSIKDGNTAGGLLHSANMETWKSPHGRALPPVGGRTLIMAVLNATPDSFSDGGLLSSPQRAVARTRELIGDGADVIDLGGESTRPGAPSISADEESGRLLPILDALRENFPDVPISIDTYKAEVADVAIAHGADMVNDVWGLMHGLTADQREQWRLHASAESPQLPAVSSAMASVVARRRCPVVVMHNRLDRNYREFWSDLLLDLKASLALGLAAGIEKAQLWTDPGFGFAKTIPQNLEVLRDLNRISALGFPVLVGTSRKSTIGAVLGATVDDRLEGSGATIVWAIAQGCQMIRVHDVREMTRFARMADAIKAGLGYVSG